ncbi:MAG: hypothetical protein ABI743_03785 [bacterium]
MANRAVIAGVGYGSGCLLTGLTVVAFVLFIVGGTFSLLSGGQKVVVPGNDTVMVEDPGSYYIYNEWRSDYEGGHYENPPHPVNLVVTLAKVGTGESITLQPTQMGNYSVNGNEGVGIYNCEIKDPGMYTLEAHYTNGLSIPKLVLSFDKDMTGGILFTVFGSLSVMFIGLGIGMALLIGTTIWLIATRDKGVAT